jgi:hypothetical protein
MINQNSSVHQKLTPEKAVEILRKEGKEITTEEAAKILEFLRNLAKIVVKDYLKNQ